ncbi:UNVERIFIED_ORG: LysR family nitrogen assimilation transcriptional regulator [Rhizobium aethiopicum]
MLDFRRLRYFVSISEYGSFSAAARAIHIAQPALSHHMAELEKELGVQLLFRAPRGVRLTRSGELLLERGRLILRDMANLEAELKYQSGSKRSVSIALTPSLSLALTGKLFSSGFRLLPQIDLRIIEARSQQGHKLVKSGEADIAISQRDPRRKGDRFLVREPLVYVTGLSGNATRVRTISLRDVVSMPLILPASGNPLRDLIDAAAKPLGAKLTVNREIDGLDAVRQMVTRGMGHAILPWSAVLEDHADKRLEARLIVDPEIGRDLVMEQGTNIAPALVDDLAIAIRSLLASMNADLPRQP